MFEPELPRNIDKFAPMEGNLIVTGSQDAHPFFIFNLTTILNMEIDQLSVI